MSPLSTLPNVGKVLEDYLLRIGLETPEQLRSMGAEAVFLQIRAQVDPGACLHMLYGLQGAIDGIPDKFLSEDTRKRLKVFYKML